MIKIKERKMEKMKITREQILSSAKNYCRQYKVNFAEMIKNHGGEEEFIKEVVAIDKNATYVLNMNSAGEEYVCKALWRLNYEPHYGLIGWAYDKGYASYSSAEIVCRGGYAVETATREEFSLFDNTVDVTAIPVRKEKRYDVEGDIIEDVKYNI